MIKTTFRTLLVCGAFAFLAASPSPAGAQTPPMDDTQFKAAIQEALQQATGIATTAPSENTNAADTASTDQAEQKSKTVYKYNKKKGLLDKDDLPQRVFNNINYPY